MHLTKLEEAGLVAIEKGFRGKVSRTSIRLTDRGRASIDRHWNQLNELRQAAGKWRPTESEKDW